MYRLSTLGNKSQIEKLWICPAGPRAHIVLQKGRETSHIQSGQNRSTNKLLSKQHPLLPFSQLHALTKVIMSHLFNKSFWNPCHKRCETYLHISHYSLFLCTLKIWKAVVLLLFYSLHNCLKITSRVSEITSAISFSRLVV